MKMRNRNLQIMLLLILQYPVTAQDFSAVDSFFSGKVAEKQLAGAVTLVARDGKIIHFRPYGYMDIEQSDMMNKFKEMVNLILSKRKMQLINFSRIQKRCTFAPN